jgi:hypothetical protein
MATTYEKVDDTLKVVKPISSTEENTYTLDALKKQEVDILKQKNDFVEARNKELVEVRALIAKCEELGIKSELEKELAEEEVIK